MGVAQSRHQCLSRRHDDGAHLADARLFDFAGLGSRTGGPTPTWLPGGSDEAEEADEEDARVPVAAAPVAEMRRQVRIRALALVAGIEYEKRIHLFFMMNKIMLHMFHCQVVKKVLLFSDCKIGGCNGPDSLVPTTRNRERRR